MSHKSRENRLRRLADKHGLHLCKSRTREHVTPDDHGGYAIVDNQTSVVVQGWCFDLDLDDVENYLTG